MSEQTAVITTLVGSCEITDHESFMLNWHINHCCSIHGCDLEDKNCPVVAGRVEQDDDCYKCEEESD